MFRNLNRQSLKDFNPEKSIGKWYLKEKYTVTCLYVYSAF